MSAKPARAALAFALIGALSPSAGAQVPSHFVPSDMCKSRDCTCKDGPMMEAFLKNQENALGAWISVRGDIFTAAGPQSMEQAVALFNMRFHGDTRVGAQFMTCAGYDPNINKLTQIAGVPGVGQAALDPCFCDAFCKDIVDSTVNHELTHAPTLLLGFSNVLADKLACKAGILPNSYCNALDPKVLADSEILSYSVGITSLSNALDRLRDRDPEHPEMECTWEPLPAAMPNRLTLEPESTPSGFWDRVGLLARRLLHGAAH